MSQSNISGATPVAIPRNAKDVDSLGPSDSSDTGSDSQGERTMSTGADNPGEWGALPVDGASDSDSAGTGERGSATGRGVRDGADILPADIRADDLVDETSTDEDTDDAVPDDLGDENDPDAPAPRP